MSVVVSRGSHQRETRPRRIVEGRSQLSMAPVPPLCYAHTSHKTCALVPNNANWHQADPTHRQLTFALLWGWLLCSPSFRRLLLAFSHALLLLLLLHDRPRVLARLVGSTSISSPTQSPPTTYHFTTRLSSSFLLLLFSSSRVAALKPEDHRTLHCPQRRHRLVERRLVDR